MPPEMGRLRNTVNGLDTYQIPKQVLECFLRKKRFFCTKTLLSDILAEPRTMGTVYNTIWDAAVICVVLLGRRPPGHLAR